MRSRDPMPGNPWPHDMVLHIAEDDDALLQLLWVRAAWDLHPRPAGPTPGAPELLPPLDRPAQQLLRRKDRWERAWAELWTRGLERLAHGRGPERIARLRATATGSPGRAALLAELHGESWTDRFGREALGDAYRQWTEALQQRTRQDLQQPLEKDPERRDLDDTIRAWRHGLTTIVTVPCAGDYQQTVGRHTLVLTRAARADPARYPAALRYFVHAAADSPSTDRSD